MNYLPKYEKVFFIRKIIKRIKWSHFEDTILLDMTQNKSRINWSLIQQTLKTKTIDMCKSRFLKLQNYGYKTGKWTKEEDKILIQLVNTVGNSWKIISKVMKNRNEKQIRSRYINYIFKGINKNKFTEKEDNLIMESYEIFKNNWSKYCKLMPDRSPRQIENRFKCLKLRKVSESTRI